MFVLYAKFKVTVRLYLQEYMNSSG